MKWWGLFFYLTFFTLLGANAVIAKTLYQYRERKRKDYFIISLSAVFFAKLIDNFLQLIGDQFGYDTPPDYTLGWAICYWLGKFLVTCSTVVFAWYMTTRAEYDGYDD